MSDVCSSDLSFQADQQNDLTLLPRQLVQCALQLVQRELAVLRRMAGELRLDVFDRNGVTVAATFHQAIDMNVVKDRKQISPNVLHVTPRLGAGTRPDQTFLYAVVRIHRVSEQRHRITAQRRDKTGRASCTDKFCQYMK